MTPAQALASLDRVLARAGQQCELRRIISGATRSVTLRAFIRDYRPTEILGGNGLLVGDSHGIISLTEINAAGWPSESVITSTTAGDPRIPIHGDKVVLSNGRVRIVQAAWPAPYIEGELVRIEMTIR